MKKVAKIGRKVKAIALLFCLFLKKWKKWLKMDETLRLYSYFFAVFCLFFKNEKSG
jgi:hypothetical protein